MTNSTGLRPTRSETAPITGNQMKLDTPTAAVTANTGRAGRRSTWVPNAGV